MARFYFAAQDKDRNVIQGDLDAQDKAGAMEVLAKRGLSPIKLEELEAAGAQKKFFNMQMSLGPGHLSPLDEINIVRHLGTILNTGTDLLSGLEMIGEDAINPFVQKMVFDIKEKISRGERFSDALKSWQAQFNPIFISLVRAGEASGNLPGILRAYAIELRKDYNFNRRLKGAMVYPVILIGALVAMLTLILTVVTPRLRELFTSTGAAPPFYTTIFFGASDFLLNNTVFAIALAGALVLGGLITWKNQRLKKKVIIALWYLPFLNKIQKNLALMRLTKVLSSLLKAGFSLKLSLTTASDVATPNYIPILTSIADEKLARGISLADAMMEYPNYFPRILISVVRTGEKSGQLASVLAQMGEFYEEEVVYALELFLTLIEPVLLLIVGLIIGLIASSLIAPLYRLIGNIH